MSCSFPDKPGRAAQAEALGVDYIIVHTGFDERNVIRVSPPWTTWPTSWPR